MASQDPEMRNSDVMYPMAATNGEATQPLVPAPTFAPPVAPPQFGAVTPRGPEILHGAFNHIWLINCLRRKWLMALLLGLLASSVAVIALLWLIPVSSQITAYLQIKAADPNTVFGTQSTVSQQEFEIFQQTQMALIKSQFVLGAALSRPDIQQLTAVANRGDDALTWLTDDLRVGISGGKGEILELRYEGEESSAEMIKVVDAVIEAYTKEVLYKERGHANELRESLSDMNDDITDELQGKISDQQKLIKELGEGDSPIASQMISMRMGAVRTLKAQIAKTKSVLIDIEVEKELAERDAKSPFALKQAIDDALQTDPTLLNYEEQQYDLTQQILALQGMTKGKSSPKIQKLQQQAAQIAQMAQTQRLRAEAELREQFKRAPNEMLSRAMAVYRVKHKRVTDLLEELEEELAEARDGIENMGGRSAKLAMLGKEIEQLQKVQGTLDFKLRGLHANQDIALDRVRVINKAQTKEKINHIQRLVIAAFGGVASFGLVCYGVALLEFRRRRLNSPADVDEGLGIRVLGALPPISSRKAMAAGSAVAAQLSEAIDNVRATLMHDSTKRARQVVLVTSAVSMEGCTTVASHLALSLTRAGRRTLLIDGDLRDPSLHKLFGMPLEDGLSELLRSEIEVSDAIRPTNTEGLWLLSAGQCDMDAVHALAADQLQPAFDKLREEFDFVIIDGAPVLGLSDTLSIGQYVDGAILTVLRDHSEVRQIYRASELLKSMGVCVIGSVVNGVTTKADRRIARLHAMEAQVQRKIASSEEI
ncbi:MAG: polysaccharide biosynthesis tyrosine autokinase [Planctomycetes bacterium]|nr:polysaccharide biosynthesis tyrosine autokinase [Planctomycetota bacterium]